MTIQEQLNELIDKYDIIDTDMARALRSLRKQWSMGLVEDYIVIKEIQPAIKFLESLDGPSEMEKLQAENARLREALKDLLERFQLAATVTEMFERDEKAIFEAKKALEQ